MDVPAPLNITRLMRAPPPSYPRLCLSPACIREAEGYSGRSGADAVETIIFKHGVLIAELRTLNRRCQQLDDEGRALDERLAALQAAARAILEL